MLPDSQDPAAPFEPLVYHGDSITLNTKGKILVLPTGNAALLPSFNEYVLNTNRLTIAESPFGGMKGAGSPDYAVGTIFTPTDGVYLTDKDGNNSNKTLTAGKLKETSCLTVDSSAKTITEEFIIQNDSTANSATPIDTGTSLTGWSNLYYAIATTPTVTLEGGRIKVVGTTDANGRLALQKNVTLDLTEKQFITLDVEASVSGTVYFLYGSALWTQYKYWSTRSAITLNTNSRYVYPLLAPVGTSGKNPVGGAGTITMNAVSVIHVGIIATAGTNVTFYIDNIYSDVGKSVFVEIDVPNNLLNSSLTLQCYTGAGYEICRVCKLDSAFSDVSSTPANVKFLDTTKLDDVYGSTLGRAVFPKGISAATVTGSTGTMTYSANKGTKNRIGLMVVLPPSDSGRSRFSEIKMKTIIKYTDEDKNIIYDLSGNGQHGTILGTAIKSVIGWIFDGDVSGKISIPAITLSRANSKIELTFKGGSTDNNQRAIVGRAASQYFSYIHLKGDTRWVGGESNVNSDYYTGINLPAGDVFRTVTVTALNNVVTFTDGISSVSTTVAADLTIDLIGNTYNGTASVPPFIGTISDVKMWNNGVLVRHYKCSINNMGATSYEFADSLNGSYGLQNLVKPWIALYDSATTDIDFFLFSERPKGLIRKKNDSGEVCELTLYPGNGQCYHGRIFNARLTQDVNSNLIPDCLEAAVEGSVTKFLQSYSFVP